MTTHMHILNAGGKLTSYLPQIDGQLAVSIPRIGDLLPVDKLDIIIAHEPAHAHPTIGIGGLAWNCNRLDLYFDGDNDNLSENIASELESVIAHEAHHCSRMAKVGRSLTLGDNIVTEGLACQFETVLTRGELPSLFKEIQSVGWEALYQRAMPHLDETDFSFEYWFLGKTPDDMPKYAGYWIGFKAVEEYMEVHKVNWQELIGVNSKALFQDPTRRMHSTLSR